ncbi:MAG: STAS/SEC14 domain-containing protein [Methylococcaceae bacterium]
MTIKLEHERDNLIVIRGSEVLKRAESDDIKKQIVTLIKRYGKMNVLIIIEKDFANLEAFANWADNEDDRFIQQHLERLAIVGDLRWRDNALLFFLNGLLPFSIEYFKASEEILARAWLLS